MLFESLNDYTGSGYLERLTVQFREDGMPVCRGTLRLENSGAGGAITKRWAPFEAYGKVAEAMGELSAGDYVVLQGKLFWRKYQTKAGEDKSGLALLVSRCTVWHRAPQGAGVASG